MFSLISKLRSVQKFLSVLSWMKNLQLLVFLLIIGSAWLVWEHRDNFVNRHKILENSEEITVSKENKQKIVSVVRKSDIIVGIMVVNVDFKKNVTWTAFVYTDNTTLNSIYSEYAENNGTQLSLFGDSEVSNKRIIDIINGQFVCIPYKESAAGKISPRSAEIVTTLCSIGIPPYYGKFSGYLNIYLNKELSPTEFERLRHSVNDLSISIFDTDIKK